MDLGQSINSSPFRLYKMYAKRLANLGIIKFEDFLYHFPFRYDNFSLISKISAVQEGEIVTVKGKVVEIKNEYTRRAKKIQRAKVSDETGVIDVIWFNQPFLIKSIHVGDVIYLSGKVERNIGSKLIFQSPEFEIELNKDYQNIHTGRLVPIYPVTYGISSKWFRRQTYKILSDNIEGIKDFLPERIIKENNFLDLKKSLWQLHFPDNFEQVERAKERLSFDELFLMQISAIKRRSEWEETVSGNAFEVEKFKEKIDDFIKSLPFELTNAQKRSVEEIIADLKLEKPMNRLLEGDVGSGKTVVSVIAMYIAYLNGYQSVLMAPTEILAMQHFTTVNNLLSSFGVKMKLVTSNTKDKKNQKLDANNQLPDVIIGTHAILSSKINFEKLGLVIIDEQQRFGVEQRALIRTKGDNPHFLTMTATPIPRTVALSMYGDLDLSYIDEMPVGRKQVKTWLVPPEKRDGAYGWIEKEILKNKSQAFIICPFIEESENMITVKAATVEFERLQKKEFPKLKLGILHGKLKSKEKEEVLGNFKAKKYDILVATPVVEVGIDIANATIILIEASDRFGLSQLHQLRGRVGRGEDQSYCLLFSESKSEKTLDRLKAMEKIYFGAELAELDLRLRGPGQLFGTLQHGIPKLKVASFSDFDLIKKAKTEAEKIFPKLKEFPFLEQKINENNIKQITPD
jgi:ATP-dependent DNA helicase RecG